MKKLLSIILAILMIATTIPFAFAADTAHPYVEVDTEAGTLTIDRTLGGNEVATEDDITALVDAIKGYLDNGITTVIVTGSEPAMITVDGLTYAAVGEALYRLSGEGGYDENNPYNGTLDLILTDIAEIVDFEFAACYAIKSVYAPTVKTIGHFAFSDSYCLTELDFPELTGTGIRAFAYGETEITYINMPKLTTLGAEIFVDYISMANNFADGAVVRLTAPGNQFDFNDRYGNSTYLLRPFAPEITSKINLILSCDKSSQVTQNDDGTASWEYKSGESLTFKTICTVEQVDAKAKTCSEIGWEAYEYCTECDYTTYKEIPASHNIEAVEEKEPTCTDIGWEAYEYCKDCNDYTTYKEIPATNHKDTLVQVEEKAKTCSEIGWDAYEYCTECDYTTYEEIPASHEIVKVEAQAKTCTEIGWEAYEYCTECDYTTYKEIPASHEIETVEAKAKTCTKVGWDAYEYCKDCTYTTKVAIPASGHTEETVKGYDATCTEAGLTDGVKCSVCGDTLTAQEVIPSNGHTEETVKGYAATCTETGLTDGVKCSVCGDTLTAQEVIPSNGHTEETIKGYAATCTETGLTDGVKCSVCGETLTAQEEIEKLPHVDEDADGYCDICGGEMVCPDCGRPVHDDSFVQNLICLIIMLIKLIMTAF